VNIPNFLTTLRLCLAVVIFALLQQPLTVGLILITVFLFTISAFTDLFDGYLARRLQLITAYGKIADPIADKALILSVLFAFSRMGFFSLWWVWPIFIREVLVTGVRLVYLHRGMALAAEYIGKLKTVIQIVTISVCFITALCRLSAVSSVILSTLNILMYIMLVAANLITVYSGYLFFSQLKIKQQ